MINYKKALSVLLIVLILLTFFPVFSYAEGSSFDLDSIYEPYYILVDADNPSYSFDGIEREADLRVEPASTTKILTCIVAIEQIQNNGKSLNDLASVSANAVNFGRGNSLMGLEEGDTFSIIDLLYGMMLPSGNDAAIAIAEAIAGSTSSFADLMNAKAQEIGMLHSHFVTVHGKHNDNHYTTVRDMALLTAYALKNPTFCEIVSSGKYTTKSGNREITVTNSNRLLIDTEPTETLPNPISCLYKEAIGVKTGDTTQAGKCLIAAAKKEGVTLIAVLFGGTLNDSTYNSGANDARKDKYNAYRFQDAIKLFEYAFTKMQRTVSLKDLTNAGLQTTFQITVPNAIETDSNHGVLILKADLPDSYTINLMEPKLRAVLDNASSMAEVNITNNYAPITDGSVVGRVNYVLNGETLFSVDLLATRTVKEGMAQVSTATDKPQVHTGGLISNGTEVVEPESNSFNCGNFKISSSQLILWILLFVILIILTVILVAFAIYLRKEKIRKEKRRRAAAKKKAQQKSRYYG